MARPDCTATWITATTCGTKGESEGHSNVHKMLT